MTLELFSYHPANIRLDKDIFCLRLQKASSQDVLIKTIIFTYSYFFRRLLQDVLIKTNIFTLLILLQKTSSRRLDQDQYIRLGHMSSRRLAKTSSRHLQDVFKTSSRRLAKTSSRRFQDVLQRCLQYLFKTYHRVKLLWLIRFQDVFETFPIYRRICLGCTSEKFMISVQNLLE